MEQQNYHGASEGLARRAGEAFDERPGPCEALAMRHVHAPTAALAAGLALALALTVPMAHGDDKPRTIAPGEIKEGMKGYGLTVFKGTVPERFDVEVVGVLHNFRPSQELILVKTPHPRLNVTKNVRGMSGSPIYFDGRLAGAYAYSWAMFQVEPVAGVTPIAPMLAELRRPIPPGFWPLEGRGPLAGVAPAAPAGRAPHAAVERSAVDFEGTPGHYDLGQHAQQMHARFAPDPSRPLVPAATPLMLGGVGDRTAASLRKAFGPLGLEPLQAGGGATTTEPGAPEHFVDGGSLGVALVRGDVSMMGLGTVTHVEGSRAVGFGHPMMEAGTTALPTALAKVLWIFASDQHSSKIGELIRPLGTLVQDRMSSVVLDEKIPAPTFPVSVELRGAVGAPKTSWRTEVAEDRFMSPQLTAAVFGAVIEASANERRDVTWRLTSKVTVRGRGTLELEDFGVATGGMPDGGDFGGTRVVRFVGDVLNNPWERTHIEKIETTFALEYTRDLWRLRGAEVLDPTVDAGRSARIRVRLQPMYGAEVTRVFEVPMREELAGKDVELEITPGYGAAPEVAAPQSLPDLMSNAAKQHLAPRSLVVQYRVRAPGVAFRGRVAPELPSFALDLLRPASSDVGPDAVASYVRAVFPLEKYVEGGERVRVAVRPVLR